jgi:glycosyltransferase involved in cell wall biosynthesis
MTQDPLVTVVIPTWNRRAFVREAARSVIAQTYPHWELIVVDDGSTDGTLEDLNALGETRLRVLPSLHSGHLGQVRNRGAVAGSGALIAFLDSDDVWLPDKLALQVKALDESGAGWCYSRFELMDADGRAIPLDADYFRLLSGDIFKDLLLFRPTVQLSTLLVSRRVFEASGRFSEDERLYRLGEDYELYMRLALHAQAVALGDALARIRKHPGSTSAARNPDSHELMARIYEVLLARGVDGSYSRLANRLWTRSLAYAGARQLSHGRLGRAAHLFGRSARHGAHGVDWTRALARGLWDGIFRRDGAAH